MGRTRTKPWTRYINCINNDFAKPQKIIQTHALHWTLVGTIIRIFKGPGGFHDNHNNMEFCAAEMAIYWGHSYSRRRQICTIQANRQVYEARCCWLFLLLCFFVFASKVKYIHFIYIYGQLALARGFARIGETWELGYEFSQEIPELSAETVRSSYMRAKFI